MNVLYILIAVLGAGLIFVCRDNNKYSDDLIDAIKQAEK